MVQRDLDIAERVQARKARAGELTAKGRIGAAAKEYLAVLELVPGDVYARQRAAELLVRAGEKGRAIEHYLCLVGKYAVEERFLKAIATCRLVLDLDPAHGETLSLLSDLRAARDAQARAPKSA
jgi:cAMP-dependent protein kinase regulator